MPPRLKRHYSVVAHGPDVVELRYGTWNPVSFTLSDDSGTGALLRLIGRLDGTASTDEIAADEGVPPAEVAALLDELDRLGVLEEGPRHALDYHLDHVIPNLAPYGLRRREGATPVVLLGDETVTGEVARVLAASASAGDVSVEPAGGELRTTLARGAREWPRDPLAFEEEAEAFAAWRDRIVVVAGATLNPLELRAFNRVSLRHAIPWIHASADGPFLLVGPTFLPHRSACYECLETRVTMNLREGSVYQSYKRALAEGRATASTQPLDAVLGAMLGSYAAFEALNFALTGTSFTVGKLLAIYLPTLEFTFNEVLRLPGCAGCGPLAEADDRELYFELRTLLDADGAAG
jgi:bacteriocin biosynthesis cyclodehydratase domain-containing protein